MNNKLILMIEDDTRVLTLNENALTRLSGGAFAFIKAETLARARQLLDASINLILLDILLPDGSGLAFVPEIRARTTAPILMLTSQRESRQIEAGLLGGGDAYMTKPYRINELYAQICAMLRREESLSTTPQIICWGELSLDTNSRRALLRGKDMNLAPKEFAMLHYFLQNKGRIISKDELYEAIWHQPLGNDANSLWKAISKLKNKLADDELGTLQIRTERGQGYELTANV